MPRKRPPLQRALRTAGTAGSRITPRPNNKGEDGLVERRPRPAFELSSHQARAGLACLRDIIAERGWPPLIWTRPDGYKFCSDPAELQAYEVAVIREKLTEIRRFITGVVAPDAARQPKGRWIKHLNTQLSSVESTLDVIADYIDA
ncbi:RacP protein [Streptomyces sp. NPDC004069]